MVVMNQNQQNTLRLAVLGGDITRSDLVNFLNVNRSTAWGLLSRLMGENFLQRMGEGTKTRYVATKKGCDYYLQNINK